MKTFLANLNHAARNGETVTIGGGEFSPAELAHVVKTINLMVDSLQHYQHGGSDYRKPAAKALEEFNK